MRGLVERVVEVRRTHEPLGHVAVAVRHEPHEARHVGVALAVVDEVVAARRACEMKLLQDHMAHRERERRVGALLRMQPQVAEFRALRIVGEHRHDLGAAIARLDEEVRIGCACLRDVGAPHHDEGRVVPVGRFGHVGLLAPGLRRCGRQVAVPVVEAQAHAADQRQIARAGRIRHHRHRRDRREADDAIGAVTFHSVDIGRRDDLVDLVPARAHETAEPAPALIRAARFVVVDDRAPCLDRRHRAAPLAPELHERAAHERMLETVRAVQVPRVRRAARAAARLVIRHVGARARIVGLLRFPRDDPAFHVDLPRARTGAVDAVRRADDLVVLPAQPVAVLPLTILVGDGTVAVGEARPRRREVTQSIQEMAHGDLVLLRSFGRP